MWLYLCGSLAWSIAWAILGVVAAYALIEWRSAQQHPRHRRGRPRR